MTSRKIWAELDTLRGFAVSLMIFNHVGISWLDLQVHNGSVTDALVYLGSYAPAVFFFVTGVGYGLSHHPEARSRQHLDVLYKAGLLLLADVFMRAEGFASLGLNFLGFIGLCMLVLHFACSGRYGNWIAVGIFCAATGLRFGFGPAYRATGEELAWLSAAIGNRSIPGFPYWPAPWLAYPALGFLFGGLLRLSEEKEMRAGGVVALVGALLLAGIGVTVVEGVMASKDMVFSRFGTVSAAYFVSTLSLLAFLAALTWGLFGSERLQKIGLVLGLRGVSSFAVVPIHIFLISLLGNGWSLPISGSEYLLLILPFVAANYALARSVNHVAARLGNPIAMGTRPWYAAAGVLMMLAAIVTISEPNLVALTLATLAQLLIAVLLTQRPRQASA